MKTGGGVFATPDDGVLTSALVRMTQEIEVSAAHEPQAAAAETDGPIAQIVGLLIRPGWNAGFAEQGSGDHAIRMAGKASVESAEGKFEPPASLGRHALRRPAADPAGRGAPQTERRFRAYGKICVERDHDGSRRCGAGTADEDDRQTVVPVVSEPMLTVGGPARECGLRSPIGLAFVNVSGAGVTRTAAGSRTGSHTIRARSACRLGSVAKPQPPAPGERLGRFRARTIVIED